MKHRFSLSSASSCLSAVALTLLCALPAQAATIVERWGQYGDIPVPGRYFPGSRIDLAIFRPIDGTWWVRSISGQVRTEQWGAPGDVPAPGDFDGDGLTDFVVFRPSDGIWHVLNSVTGVATTQQWGTYGDIPVPGDYDGDNHMDFAVWRPGTGVWWVKNSVTGAVTTKQWGWYGDIPVPGQYDGWIGDDFTVFRPLSGPVSGPSTAVWFTYGSSQFGPATSAQWGEVVDIPVSAHFNCYTSGHAIFRPEPGTWWIHGVADVTWWGAPGDIPVAADYLGSDSADFAVFRPSTGTWWVLENPTVCLN